VNAKLGEYDSELLKTALDLKITELNLPVLAPKKIIVQKNLRSKKHSVPVEKHSFNLNLDSLISQPTFTAQENCLSDSRGGTPQSAREVDESHPLQATWRRQLPQRHMHQAVA
jgi:hypothetical protein